MNASDVVATSAVIAGAVYATNHTADFRERFGRATSDMLLRISAVPAASNFAAGATAGAISRTITAPLDRVKVLAQEGRICVSSSCRSTPNDFHRMIALSHHIYLKDGGLRAFWRGNGINCLKAGPEYAVAFSVRQATAERMCHEPAKPSGIENFVLGAISGFTAQSILYPLETAKTRMAVARPNEYTGVFDCFSQSLRRGGLRDLYRGLGANLVGVVPHRSIEMGMFFTLEQTLTTWHGEGQSLPLGYVTGAGFVASVVSQVATYPLNLARTKLQTQGVNGRPIEFTGLRDCIATVVRKHGVSGLFVGLLPNMLKAAPASTIMYTVFRSTKSHLDQLQEKPI